MKPGHLTYNYEQYKSGKYDLVARDGSKPTEIHVFASHDSYPLGVVHEDGVIVMHTLDGLEIIGECTERDVFLCEKAQTMFANIYLRTGKIHTTREKADKYATQNRIACVEVTYTPGQGL